MAFRKTNVGGQITFDPQGAAKELLKTFSIKRGVFTDVAKHYGVATTTVRRWLTTLASEHSIDLAPRIERIREIALEVG
jgi:hypothetical protein